MNYDGPHKAGTIVIDTNERFLYLVQSDGTARRYGVGVGKPGFEWAAPTRSPARRSGRTGVRRRKCASVAPTCRPSWPADRRTRSAHAPCISGPPSYRIHGSNQPWTIGHAVSSGCIRMRNEDVMDLYERVKVGTTVHVI